MARGRNRFLDRLGPAALAQLEARGLIPKKQHQGRITRAPKEERTLDGIVFDSKWEMRVFELMRDALGADSIELQPEFILQEAFTGPDGKKVRAITYTADFLVRRGDASWVVDAKGMLTEIFKRSEKMFLFRYRRPLIKLHTVSQVMTFLDEVKNVVKIRSAS